MLLTLGTLLHAHSRIEHAIFLEKYIVFYRLIMQHVQHVVETAIISMSDGLHSVIWPDTPTHTNDLPLDSSRRQDPENVNMNSFT